MTLLTPRAMARPSLKQGRDCSGCGVAQQEDFVPGHPCILIGPETSSILGPMPSILIRGARTHNLRNIDLELPRDRLIVFTGLSGSGKSSLAFDTIYAEGQRRYVESLSAYARQFLSMMEKPDVDFIEGLSPAISIDQKSASRNP